jgi:hypothetical protein
MLFTQTGGLQVYSLVADGLAGNEAVSNAHYSGIISMALMEG